MTLPAVILAGGLGTRLAALYPELPKALVPVAGVPFLRRQLEWLAAGGVRRAHLALGHKHEQILAWLNAAAVPDMEFSVSVETTPLGTAGALKRAEPHLAEENFLALNGDTLLPKLDFGRFLRAFSQSTFEAVLAVTRSDDVSRSGLVQTEADGTVLGFSEKKDFGPGMVNGGLYAMRKAALRRIPQSNMPLSLERDVFPAMAAERRLGAFATPPPLLDMGTAEGLAEMERYFRGKILN